MARYIDADELEIEYYGLSIHGTMAVKSVLPIFTDLLEKQPTADVVEVVRCKDCTHREKDDVGRYFCALDDCYCGDEDYCSRGERRTDNDL